jgi:hypothetical protein
MIGGPKAWEVNETLRRAIEINDGVSQNPRILSFQRGLPHYPHLVTAAAAPMAPMVENARSLRSGGGMPAGS